MLLHARRLRLVFGLLLFIIIIVLFNYKHQLQDMITYASRPLWDKFEGPSNLIPHYYASGIPIDGRLCRLHGWESRPPSKVPEVYDAILFSSELDLLEIRLNELNDVVDKFFILESNVTFTGLPKPTFFADARTRFSKFQHKIVYGLWKGRELAKGESPFELEKDQRNAMTKLINSHMSTKNGSPPLVILADADEMPSGHTIRLLKTCQFPSPVHLQLRNYIYSFEFPQSKMGSWRAQVHEWGPTSFYRHGKVSENILADSGWHCSFCFATLSEFVAKMTGYSHADRLGNNKKLLTKERIQRTICQGLDIFDMLPEAYSYEEMLEMLHPVPSRSAVGLPRHLIEHADQFKFLLPNGCIRKS